jgi:hypothetical protein
MYRHVARIKYSLFGFRWFHHYGRGHVIIIIKTLLRVNKRAVNEHGTSEIFTQASSRPAQLGALGQESQVLAQQQWPQLFSILASR